MFRTQAETKPSQAYLYNWSGDKHVLFYKKQTKYTIYVIYSVWQTKDKQDGMHTRKNYKNGEERKCFVQESNDREEGQRVEEKSANDSFFFFLSFVMLLPFPFHEGGS
jgi:hypothetical protein